MGYPTYEISPQISHDIYDAAYEVAKEGGGELFTTEEGIRHVVKQSQLIVDQLAMPVREELSDFAQHGNSAGMFVLKGLEIAQSIDAIHPRDGNTPDSPGAQAMAVTGTVAATLLGPPISYTTNPRGREASFIANVAPAEIDERDTTMPRINEVRTGRSTGWHSEAGTAPTSKRIQFLSLLCLRPQTEVATQVISSTKLADAITRLHGKDRMDALQEHSYLLSEPIVPGSDVKRRPIASITDRGFAFAYGESYVDTADKYTKDALGEVAAAIKTVTPEQHALDKGDVLYIDNHGLHCRDAFVPKRRWLMRVFVGHDLMEDTFVDPTDTNDL